jgi:hypothetical protein
MLLLAVLFAVTIVALGSLIGYRAVMTRDEDDTIHLAAHEAALIPKQVELAHRLEALGRWIGILTVASSILGVSLFGMWAYRAWQLAFSTP